MKLFIKSIVCNIKKKKRYKQKLKGQELRLRLEINNIRPIIPRNANGNEP